MIKLKSIEHEDLSIELQDIKFLCVCPSTSYKDLKSFSLISNARIINQKLNSRQIGIYFDHNGITTTKSGSRFCFHVGVTNAACPSMV